MGHKTIRRIALFGATGSIGRQALDVIDKLGGFEVVMLTAGRRWEDLAAQCHRWKPKWAVLSDERYKPQLQKALHGLAVELITGPDAVAEAAKIADYDLCLNGLVGVAGLLPSYNSLKRGIDLALANKESLVLAGDLLNSISAQTGARILPIDSEHSAILQCLQGENIDSVKRLILTASGGPFREWSLERIATATPEEALRHPTWRMGPKITIDSATLMNKGFEVIEAYHLFNIPVEKVEVRIHPVSIVHSMVEFIDGSFKAQLGTPDMRHPIQYALTYPERSPLFIREDDPVDWQELNFRLVDPERYPCLGLAFHALESGGTATAVLNGADEAAVDCFLSDKIQFGDISRLIDEALDHHTPKDADLIENILDADKWGRNYVQENADRA